MFKLSSFSVFLGTPTKNVHFKLKRKGDSVWLQFSFILLVCYFTKSLDEMKEKVPELHTIRNKKSHMILCYFVWRLGHSLQIHPNISRK